MVVLLEGVDRVVGWDGNGELGRLELVEVLLVLIVDGIIVEGIVGEVVGL